MNKIPNKSALVLGAMLAASAALSAHAQSVLLWSSQANKVTETKSMQENVFKGAPVPTEFIGQPRRPLHHAIDG